MAVYCVRLYYTPFQTDHCRTIVAFIALTAVYDLYSSPIFDPVERSQIIRENSCVGTGNNAGVLTGW